MSVKLTIQICLLSRLKISGAIRLHPPYAFVACTGKNLPLYSPYISYFLSLFSPLLLFLSLYIFLYINFSFSLFNMYSFIFFFCTLLYFLFIFLSLSILLYPSLSNSFSISFLVFYFSKFILLSFCFNISPFLILIFCCSALYAFLLLFISLYWILPFLAPLVPSQASGVTYLQSRPGRNWKAEVCVQETERDKRGAEVFVCALSAGYRYPLAR
jgi:signal transduction histidine kinase